MPMEYIQMRRDAGSPRCRHVATCSTAVEVLLLGLRRARSAADTERDSARNRAANRTFSAHRTAATRPGAWSLKPCDHEPMAGPNTTPALVAADSQPNPLARLRGSTLSVTYAWITAVVPPPAPCTARDSSSSQYESAYAKTTYAIAEAPSPMRSAGLRPYRSDTRPQSGALTSCMAENADTSTITMKSLAPNLTA